MPDFLYFAHTHAPQTGMPETFFDNDLQRPQLDRKGWTRRPRESRGPDAILVPGRNCGEIIDIEHAGVLVDGRDYYLSFYCAAREAERHILISGWQFDTGVKLLRGEDAEKYGDHASFLSFLNTLCARKPGLRIYILAWDYNIFFLHEREWFQERIVKSRSNGQVRFLLDGSHAVAGSHHQKFAIIDSKVAFAGGADICANRWDTRHHHPTNPDRINPDNKLHGPYHEIQSYITGPAVNALIKLFRERWERAGGEALAIPEIPDRPFFVKEGIPIKSRKVAMSRTLPRMFFPYQEPVEEIRNLYLDAIASAERHIYIENQYFSSRAMHEALAEKMSTSGPKLEIIIVLPKQQTAFLEEISVGVAQSKLLRSLKDIAAARGHSLGIYYTAAVSDDGVRHPVYIHSKVLIVDDRFLSVGSANFTNRSQRIDTELNLSWEAGHGDDDLVRSIRRIRVALLAEHAGIAGCGDIRRLHRASGLSGYLDGLADRDGSRLCRHPMTTTLENNPWVKLIPTFAIDPEQSIIEDKLHQIMGRDFTGLLVRGMALLAAWFQRPKI